MKKIKDTNKVVSLKPSHLKDFSAKITKSKDDKKGVIIFIHFYEILTLDYQSVINYLQIICRNCKLELCRF